jgi:hypothetical protein
VRISPVGLADRHSTVGKLETSDLELQAERLENDEAHDQTPGKNGPLLASWYKTTGKGNTLLKLLLPSNAKHMGNDRLEILVAAAKTANCTVT